MISYVRNLNSKMHIMLLNQLQLVGMILGRSLDISLDMRKELRRDGALSNDDRLEEILNTWLQTQGTTATWSSLIDALKENGLNDIVTDIKQKL